MFEQWSYLGYTLLFCLPPLALLWLRGEFSTRMARDVRQVAAVTAVLTFYGCAAWPVALKMGAWAYADTRILNVKILGWVHVEDAAWWFLVSALMASFVSLSARYEDEGVDIVLGEALGILRSLACACRGLRMLRLERNTTIHIAAAVFVVLEAVLLRVTALEWLALVLAMGAVIALELINSVLERVASRLAPGQDAGIRLMKDAAAAAVLVTSVAAAAVGAVVFMPRILPAVF
jgi:diacylglycerol kinase (ATP)